MKWLVDLLKLFQFCVGHTSIIPIIGKFFHGDNWERPWNLCPKGAVQHVDVFCDLLLCRGWVWMSWRGEFVSWHGAHPCAAAAAAAAAKSLQSCPTLYDPTDGSPPGSTVPGILQARTLEWVAISFSNAWKWKWSRSVSVRLFVIPWTTAYQAPPSMGFSRQEYWSGVPLPSPKTMLLMPNFLTYCPSSRKFWAQLCSIEKPYNCN